MYTSSRSILWIVGFSFGSNSTWKDVTTSHSMSWLNQCTVGLSPSNNCIREFRSFAPIFLGNDCLRVRYLDISFTFDTYIWTGRVEWRQWRLRSQEKLLWAGERFCCKYLGRVDCHMVLWQCFLSFAFVYKVLHHSTYNVLSWQEPLKSNLWRQVIPKTRLMWYSTFNMTECTWWCTGQWPHRPRRRRREPGHRGRSPG